MNIDYHSSLIQFIAFDKLPLWVKRIGEGCHPEQKFHNHEYSEIVFILKGHATHLTEKASAPIKAGDVLVIHPGQVHAYNNTGNMELVNIIYDRRKLPLPLLDGYSLPLFKTFFPTEKKINELNTARPVMNLKAEDLSQAIVLIERLESELKNLKPGNFFCSLALFMEIIVLITRLSSDGLPEHHAHFLIGNAVSFMKKNFGKTISIEKLAYSAKMSERNFFRLFKNTIGCTPINYLLRIRLHHASEMLTSSDASISEIALSCGFYDSNYFCRKFKEVRNMTPRQFRLKTTAKPKKHSFKKTLT
jgi:AraC-like DNA-binding protein